MEFQLTELTIVEPHLDAPSAGALVTFQGLVRNSHKGRNVTKLEYEAYSDMAQSEGKKLILEAIQKFELTSARAIHRIGLLEIGDVAVWIGVMAPHRKKAFEACEFIIDELKVRVPIWKKEFYEEGDSGWINQE